jgi:hypothetical protein
VTVLDGKLFREKAEWPSGIRSTLLFCTRYEDAVAPPFPAEGKKGLSVWVGPLAAFKDPKARLLWELEKRRKRPTLVVLTSQKGRSFLRSYREVGTLLGDTSIAPASFLRRRGQQWDSLDFFSAGDSDFMGGANPRLKRLKQAGWESMVDRVALLDAAIKTEYFETLQVPRERLIAAAVLAYRQLKLSLLVGIAGECLTRESLFSLLGEPFLQGVISQVKGQAPPQEGSWLLLSHRQAGSELLFYGNGAPALEVGQIMLGQIPDKGKAELAVAEIKQVLRPDRDPEAAEVFCWARVDWRYPPEREIPTLWKQKSALSAGSHPPRG